jgi:hypothetical protein
MIDPLLGLLLLWAFSKGGKSATPGGGSLFPSPRAGKPADKGGGGASAFPVTPPQPSVPVRSASPPAKWKPYPAPIPAAVIARAQALLRDPTMRINDERLEPDPAGSGPVRYWKVNQPPGKVSVTAWRPSLAQAQSMHPLDRPAGNAPPSQRPLMSTLSTRRPTAKGRSAEFPGRPGPRGAGGGPGFTRGAGGGPQ